MCMTLQCALRLRGVAPRRAAHYDEGMDDSANLVPWQPQSLEELIEEPFQRLERALEHHALARLERMEEELAEMELELDQFLAKARISVGSL